jgi:5-amino-6-(5-phospho-D-ribitylamino)uracil phosphatase
MPIRLIALDLDGTLLTTDRRISQANLDALTAAQSCGIRVVVVTGRRFHSALPHVRAIPFAVTLIASNGALIGTTEGETVYRDFLPRAIAQQVLQAVPEYRPFAAAIFDIPCRGQVTMQTSAIPEGPYGWYLANNPESLALVPDLAMALETDPVQILFGGPPELIEPVEGLLRGSAVAPHVHLTWTKYLMRNISLLDVMNCGCTKGRTLAWWAERCGISREEVMAIGDNFNDLEMLQFAGHAVVMANCSQGLHRSGWSMTRSNDEDGVAEAIRAHVLRRETA